MSMARALIPDADADDVPVYLQPNVPDQLSPSRELDLSPPCVLDVLRQCRPSRELIGLLSREATKAATAGATGDAAALIALALCVREVVPR